MYSFTLVLTDGRMFFTKAGDEGQARFRFKQMIGRRGHLPQGSLVKFGFYVNTINFVGE